MRIPKSIAYLVEELQKLPSVGPKSAERLTYFLLRMPASEAEGLAEAILNLKKEVQTCSVCYNYAEKNPCGICGDAGRQQNLICVVEEPLDVLAIEKTGKFSGVYHVLGGRLNPVAGIGPEEIRVAELVARLRGFKVQGSRFEVILATNPTLEGEATAMYIRRQLRAQSAERRAEIKITRIARGLPTGGDLGYADEVTVGRALEGRSEY